MTVTMGGLLSIAEELIPEQYAEGATTAQLHRQWGLSTYKITALVKAAGVYDPNRKSGAPLRDFCQRMHDQLVHRKFSTDGYPYCGECKRLRQRVGFKVDNLP